MLTRSSHGLSSSGYVHDMVLLGQAMVEHDTSTDCSTVPMIDITDFSPGIRSPSIAFSITLSPFMTATSMSEDVEVWEPSAARAGGIGECGCK